jgi:hypothetical protein
MTFLDPKALKKSVFPGTKLYQYAGLESEELIYIYMQAYECIRMVIANCIHYIILNYTTVQDNS